MTNNLLSVKDARAHILSAFQPVPTEQVEISVCSGRILAQAVHAPADLPAFDNSSMDGFAVRAQDIQSASNERPVSLVVIGDIPAGKVPGFSLEAGQAARVMTGAPIPTGADAVVPVENTDRWNFDAENQTQSNQQPSEIVPNTISVLTSVKIGDYIRPRGQDIRAGQPLLMPGRKLLPQDAGLLASIGHASVTVYRQPRVALLSSGDELVQPGMPLSPGQIYDSNQTTLAALLRQAGAQVFALGIVRDDPEQVSLALNRCLDLQVDLIVTSAGVSVGAFDYIRHVIETHGKLSFWRVNMRPGKPLAFGFYQGIPLIGLPGNPVSSYVGCRVFVLPAIQQLAGLSQTTRPLLHAIITHPIESDGRESYLRAIVQEQDGQWVASLTGHQGSGNLLSLVQANALLIVPSGVKSLPSGSEVEFWFLDLL